MKQTSLYRLLALLLALALVAAACGGDDGDDGVDAGGDDTADDGDAAADDGDAGGDDDAPAAGDEAEGDVDTEVEAVEESPPTGGSIIVGLEAESTGLRPWEDTCSSPCANMLFTLFDPLVERDVDGNYVPYLLESLSSNDDFTVWSGTLRSGVVFNNGDPLTAQTIADMFRFRRQEPPVPV